MSRKRRRIITLKNVETSSITIDVRDIIGRISPYIYGYFTENLANIIYGGIWAEMLRNRKFEVPDLNHDGLSDPWEPIGKDKFVEYTHDCEVSYSGKCSQRITVLSNDGKLRGIAQSRISVVKGRKYVVTLYLKQKNFDGKVTVALGENERKIYASQTIDNCPSEWKRYSLSLIPHMTDANCKFMILLNGAGTIWVDAASLMPADNLNGLRKEVITLAKEVDPPVIRWPGGCFADGYHWKDGIGHRDQRPVRLDPAWKCWEPNDFGTDEFIQFCKAVGAEPYICLNFGSGTVEEAIKWVEYCNGDPSTLEGSRRAANGHPEPYGVRFWGVGNEVCYPTEIGHTDAATYAKRLIEYCKALKKMDSKIKVVAVGCLASWPRDSLLEIGVPLPESAKKFLDSLPGWNRTVLEIAGEYIDFLSVHWYVPMLHPAEMRLDENRIYHVIVAAPQDLERMLKETEATIEKVLRGRRDVKIILDEWNMNFTSQSDIEKTKEMLSKMTLDGSIDKMRTEFTLRDALFAAGVLNVLQRLCEYVYMANLATLVNAMGLILVDQAQACPSSLYPVFKVYTKYSGEFSVRTKVKSPSFDVARTGAVPSLKNVPYLDCSASLSEDRKKLYLHVINRHPSKDLICRICLLGCSPREEAKVLEINAPDVLSKNSFKKSDVVKISEHTIKGVKEDFEYKFPAHSITSMVIHLSSEPLPIK